jgi:hypothetical protein
MDLVKKVSLAGCLAVFVLGILTGCQGVGVGGLTPTPTPMATPAGSLQSVNHIFS